MKLKSAALTGSDAFRANREAHLSLLSDVRQAAEAAAADPALIKAGEKVFRKCKSCHQIGAKAKNRVGPVLNGIVDGPAGAVEDFRYSKPMAAAAEAGLVWTESELSAFLGNPKGYMKGTKMSFPGVRKEEDIDALIAYLRDASE
jgi:cytochrome c